MGGVLNRADDEVVALRCLEHDGTHVLPLETADTATDARHGDVLDTEDGGPFLHGLKRPFQGIQAGISAGFNLSEEVVEGVGTMVLVIVDTDGEASAEGNEVPLAVPHVFLFGFGVHLGNLVSDSAGHGSTHVHPVGDGIAGKSQGIGVGQFSKHVVILTTEITACNGLFSQTYLIGGLSGKRLPPKVGKRRGTPLPWSGHMEEWQSGQMHSP